MLTVWVQRMQWLGSWIGGDTGLELSNSSRGLGKREIKLRVKAEVQEPTNSNKDTSIYVYFMFGLCITFPVKQRIFF